ncbi:MAG: AraC family transcriptional regulator [Pseudomonadota bacterium]
MTATSSTSDSDPISAVLLRLRLRAKIFKHARYCGTWSVDTSGTRSIPFHLIQHGRCWLHVADTTPRELAPGDLVVLPHDGRHVIASTPTLPPAGDLNQARDVDAASADNMMLCGFFLFESEASWPLLDALPPVIVLEQRTHHLGGLVDVIFAELEAPQSGSQALLASSSQGLFVYALREAVRGGTGEDLLSAMLDERLAPVFAAIHADPAAPQTVETLAERAFMSRSAFADRFKKVTGLAPMRYLQNWRLQVALDLLTSTTDAVASVAEQVGYASEVSFRQAFRKELGMTPNQARQQPLTDP